MRGQLITAALMMLSAAMPTAWAQQPEADGKILVDTLPQSWTYDEHFPQTSPTDDVWWHYFDDATLDTLIRMGLDYNYNATMAVRRIETARLQMEQARAGYFPNLTAQAGWTKARTSGYNYSPATKAADMSYFNLGVSMSWEVDIFGKVSSQVKERKANVQLSRADYAALQVSLAAEIANAYITLRTYQNQLKVANAHIASQEHILHMTEARHEAGLASALDVSQARVVLLSTKASIPVLEGSIRTTINSISVLVGTFPDRLGLALSTPAPMPGQYHIVGIGVPAELLRRRPDIIQAEYTLAADAARLGIAKKDFLPSLSINGSVGTSAHNIGDLFKGDSFNYSIAPTLSWTIFDGFSRKYAAAQAREAMQLDIDNYNLTVQTAVEEVDNAIITYAGTLQNIDLLQQTVQESDKALNLSVDLYRSSLSSFTNVVNAQLDYLTYENSLVSAQGNALKSLVALYKALGGGWVVEGI